MRVCGCPSGSNDDCERREIDRLVKQVQKLESLLMVYEATVSVIVASVGAENLQPWAISQLRACIDGHRETMGSESMLLHRIAEA